MFLNASGGTGKTYVLNCALSFIRLLGHESIALASAFSGTAAALLDGGKTFHSTFKYPIGDTAESNCNVPKQGNLAKFLLLAKAIVIDEASMSHRHTLEALDRTLRDITGHKEAPFGRKIIILGGHFKQIPPEAKNGNRGAIVDASIKNSHL